MNIQEAIKAIEKQGNIYLQERVNDTENESSAYYDCISVIMQYLSTNKTMLPKYDWREFYREYEKWEMDESGEELIVDEFKKAVEGFSAVVYAKEQEYTLPIDVIFLFKLMQNYFGHHYVNSQPTLYLDMDNVIVDFVSSFEHFTPEQVAHNADEVEGIFNKMAPMPGAIEAIEKLYTQYNIYLLSTAPWHNPSAWSDKLLWVQKYLPLVGYKRLILSHNKQLNVGDYLIDDRYHNGAIDFKGTHLHFGKGNAYPTWNSILEKLYKPSANEHFVENTKHHCIIYFYGWGGGPHSKGLLAVQNNFTNARVVYFEYNQRNPINNYTELHQQITQLQSEYKNILIIGNSLGGYWANYFAEEFQLPCILINPSLHPQLTLGKYKVNQNYLNNYKPSTFAHNTNKKLFLSLRDTVLDNKATVQAMQDVQSITWVDEEHAILDYGFLVEAVEEWIKK